MAEVSAADVPFLDFRTTRFAVNVNQLDSISNEFLNIPPDLCNNFWSTNTENQKMITPSDTIINPCCPLLVGPCCSPIRRNDFKKMFLSFVIWQIIAQVVMFFLTKTKDITPLQDYIIDEKTLISYGALSFSKVRKENQYWRFLSCIFLHSSLPHFIITILIEMFFLFGMEKSWTFLKFFPAFIISSIIGSLCIISIRHDLVVVGSGFGIFGIFGVFLITYFFSFSNLIWRHRIGMLFLIMFIIGMLILYVTQSADGNLGYVTGFLFGLSFGIILFSKKITEFKKRVIYIFFATLVSLIIITFSVFLYIREK